MRCQLDLDFPRNGPSDFRLYRQHIVKTSLVALSPQMRFVADADELRRDAHTLPRASYRAFQDMRHTELAANLRGALRSRLELHPRGSGDHSEPLRAQASQLGDHFLG